MKSSNQTIFTCTKCDAQFQKWSGRCLACGAWGTISEDVFFKNANPDKSNASPKSQAGKTSKKAMILDIDNAGKNINRISSSIPEFDRVLGGGFVPGSLVLLGGQPGIGKSTLVLQLCKNLPDCLYVSGEESGDQILMRLARIGMKNTKIKFLPSINIEEIISHIIADMPSAVIIDSIQTMYSNEIESEAGSVSQVRTCTGKLLEIAKTKNVPIIIIGHVTKDGQVAGPKTLEHIVDTVLYLEGDALQYYRLLRSVKNRFGSTNEIGVFEMTEQGLCAVANPSEQFIKNADQTIPGSVVTVICEGKRSFLVEIQSLVNKTIFGMPQRKASGYDNNRMQMLLAVISKRINLNFSQYDVFLNIIGGLKSKEVAIDLAVCMSLISAYKNKILDNKIVAVGEIGLGGEIRPIPFLEKRIMEAKNLGFKKIYVPKLAKNIPNEGIELIQLKNLKDLVK